MAEHFLAGLVEGPPGFKPEPWYNSHGDCLEYVLANEGIVGDRIDEVITIYRSLVDRRPIGFQIKGISALLKEDGRFVEIHYVHSKDSLKSVMVTFGAAIALALKKSFQEPQVQTKLQKYADLFDVVKAAEQDKDTDAELCIPAGADR
jgi:hypothetical protein